MCNNFGSAVQEEGLLFLALEAILFRIAEWFVNLWAL